MLQISDVTADCYYFLFSLHFYYFFSLFTLLRTYGGLINFCESAKLGHRPRVRNFPLLNCSVSSPGGDEGGYTNDLYELSISLSSFSRPMCCWWWLRRAWVGCLPRRRLWRCTGCHFSQLESLPLGRAWVNRTTNAPLKVPRIPVNDRKGVDFLLHVYRRHRGLPRSSRWYTCERA